MIRLVLSKVPPGGRFKRFWVPSLTQIESFVRPLLDNSSAAPTVDSERVAALIRRVRVGGTNKSTSPARLESADAAVLSQLTGSRSERLQFLDVGCSDGTTSMDSVERFERALGCSVSAHLMDRYIWIRRLSRLPITEFLSSDDGLVMAQCGPLALAPAPPSFALAPLTNRLVSAYLALADFRRGMTETGRFPLLSPRVLARKDVTIIEGSVLITNEDIVGRMHVVRASNLLHYDYFSENQLVTGISNLARYVIDGGLLVISRNHEEQGGEIERGTVWRRTGHTLTTVAEFGGGSELRTLVNSLEPLGRP